MKDKLWGLFMRLRQLRPFGARPILVAQQQIYILLKII